MKRLIILDSNQEGQSLVGVLNRHSACVEEHLPVQISLSSEGLEIQGDGVPCEQAEAIFNRMLEIVRREGSISDEQVRYFCSLAASSAQELPNLSSEVICVTAKGRTIRAKTAGQIKYLAAIRKNELSFAIGPAGTGKTFLAVAAAVKALRAHEVGRIILTRPAVEAGENLGFLPGDLQSKVDPYMRPLYDALYELLGVESFTRLLERSVIEISPLAYMRGRTLDDAFIILDEAQNTSPEQMKMFLTRIGFASRTVVTGDITQIDLPPNRKSGLVAIEKILTQVQGVSFVHLTGEDVVRNPLVQRIIKAYELHEAKTQNAPKFAPRSPKRKVSQ